MSTAWQSTGLAPAGLRTAAGPRVVRLGTSYGRTVRVVDGAVRHDVGDQGDDHQHTHRNSGKNRVELDQLPLELQVHEEPRHSVALTDAIARRDADVDHSSSNR